MDVYLDGYETYSPDGLHELMKEQLELPDFYGKNLDALYDVLSTWHGEITIRIKNYPCFMDRLGDYGQAFISTLRDVQEEKPQIHVIVEGML